MKAEISECGTYRYTLKRDINQAIRWVKPCLFIMLNPSTADAVQDDPTIRRCIKFSEREGCTSLTVVNLFALRATDPNELKKHSDPIGPLNDQRIEEMVDNHSLGIVVAAWGAHPMAQKRGTDVRTKFGLFKCLGITKNGSPKHPLYVRADQELVDL